MACQVEGNSAFAVMKIMGKMQLPHKIAASLWLIISQCI